MVKYGKRFTSEQKDRILSEHLENGVSISELSRKHQISAHTIYKWKASSNLKEDAAFLDKKELLDEINRLKDENSRLKHTVADQALDITTLKQWNDFIKKKLREERLNSQESSAGPEQSKPQKKGSVS